MKRILKEPVVHFAIFAILLFIYFQAAAKPEQIANTSNRIVVGDREVEQIITQYRATWQQPPTPEQLETLIEGYIREEVLVRSALELGLDRGDAAIRNRLRQKMQFLTDSAAQSLDPGEEVLAEHLTNNPDRFSRPGRIAFDQVYLGASPTEVEVTQALSSLKSGEAPATVGQSSLLPSQVPLSVPVQIDGGFGQGFHAGLAELPQGDWVGPVRSGYGLHLIRVTEVEQPELPDLDLIRDKVLFDWRREQADVLAEAQFNALRTGYEIIQPDAADLQQVLGQ